MLKERPDGQHLEAVAIDRILDEAGQHRAPVNVGRIAAHLGVVLQARPDLPDVLRGWLSPGPHGPQIVANARRDDDEIRWWIACALVDWLADPEAIRAGGVEIDGNTPEILRRNQLAARLLVPEPLLRATLRVPRSLPDLCHEFMVPEAVMVRRLLDLDIPAETRLLPAIGRIFSRRCLFAASVSFVCGVIVRSVGRFAAGPILQNPVVHIHAVRVAHTIAGF